ncbi:MAG TPA: 4Fe-4S dicluster domain-containing protein [Fimbriimonadaceae bacterium]|nr:4Fe-4S dicluster domain-containing protein [Fimbriimonadaceae bacterium]
MQYGFVIDQDACIGCHACTVACKAENDVPVGGFRTSVKYVETGKFPAVKRSFLVQRCNHCTNPPCVAICPVGALTKRADGIVDVDRDLCIGCRACMQACPYDALYLNEDLGAVEKCHFCAHRIEKGLQPACVTVCPVGAIIPGDFHDPESRVSLISKAKVLSARRMEQETGPNVRYIGASEIALEPGSAEKPPMYIWSQRREGRPEAWPVATEPDAREVLNSEPRIEWGWTVALYLLTKGIAGGAAIVAPFLFLLGSGGTRWWAPEALAVLLTLVTVFLLVEDLAKPTHFMKLFTRPNWNSWLVKGGIVLTAFGGVSAAILLLGLTGRIGQIGLVEELRWGNAVLGASAAGYTAFLFAQCKGRDLWESRLLLPHLLVQAVLCGSVVLMPFGAGSFGVAAVFGAAVLAHLGFAWHEGHRAETENARQAAGFLTSLRLGPVSMLTASAALLVLAVATAFAVPAAAWVPAFAGLFLYEAAFVRAGQLPTLS